MSDLISREAVIDAVNNAFDKETLLNGFVRSIAVRAIRDMPSAQPEIVRCKNCKHFNRGISCVGGFYDGCDELTDNGNEMPVDEAFYCGYAERKTDG